MQSERHVTLIWVPFPLRRPRGANSQAVPASTSTQTRLETILQNCGDPRANGGPIDRPTTAREALAVTNHSDGV
jgi:hypothetical protein